MKTLSLKQIRNAALCLVAAGTLACGANALRVVAQPAPHTVSMHSLLADGGGGDGQETHGGKGGHRSASISHIA